MPHRGGGAVLVFVPRNNTGGVSFSGASSFQSEYDSQYWFLSLHYYVNHAWKRLLKTFLEDDSVYSASTFEFLVPFHLSRSFIKSFFPRILLLYWKAHSLNSSRMAFFTAFPCQLHKWTFFPLDLTFLRQFVVGFLVCLVLQYFSFGFPVDFWHNRHPITTRKFITSFYRVAPTIRYKPTNYIKHS